MSLILKMDICAKLNKLLWLRAREEGKSTRNRKHVGVGQSIVLLINCRKDLESMGALSLCRVTGYRQHPTNPTVNHPRNQGVIKDMCPDLILGLNLIPGPVHQTRRGHVPIPQHVDEQSGVLGALYWVPGTQAICFQILLNFALKTPEYPCCLHLHVDRVSALFPTLHLF